jgi:hypothetical protein
MNTAIHHLDEPHQALHLTLDFHDNPSRQACVAINEDSLYRPPTMHLAFHMGMAYNGPAPPGEQEQMGHNHTVNMRV